MSREVFLPSELDFLMKLITADKVCLQLGICLQLSVLRYSSFNFRVSLFCYNYFTAYVLLNYVKWQQ